MLICYVIAACVVCFIGGYVISMRYYYRAAENNNPIMLNSKVYLLVEQNLTSKTEGQSLPD